MACESDGDTILAVCERVLENEGDETTVGGLAVRGGRKSGESTIIALEGIDAAGTCGRG